MFKSNLIAFATISSYPKWYTGKLKSISHTDKIRGDLALEFINKALSQGFHLVLVEAKSSKSFKKELKGLSKLINNGFLQIVKRKSPKRSPAKRQAFKQASKIPGIKVIITTELEKISLLKSIVKITAPVIENKADIVIPKRVDNLFRKTYPFYMYNSEVKGNEAFNQTLRSYSLLPPESSDLDMFFGPRVFRNSKEVLRLFTSLSLKDMPNYASFDPEEYFNTLYSPIILALKKGFRVKSVVVSFSYPKMQNINESIGARKFFVNKRRAQRVEILLALTHLLNSLGQKREQ